MVRAMGPIDSFRTRLRSLLGDKVYPRRYPRRGRKPRIGAAVVHVQECLRLVVQAGMSDELWIWLQDQGWRTETYQPDRRLYRDVPASFVTRLIDAHPTHRAQLLAEAISSARARPPATKGNH